MEAALFGKLQKFGLNLYEAKAYAAMLKIGTANAYNISKESGIPRARIYDVLASLTARGLSMLEESSDNVKNYTPIPSKVFLERMKEEWQSDYEEVKNDLQYLESEENKQGIYVFTVKGAENIMVYCKQLLKEADHHIMVSIWGQMYEQLLPALKECRARGCRVAGIGHEIDTPMEGIEQHTRNKIHNTAKKTPWFILSVDSKKMLYGHAVEVNKDAFYTEDATHIYLMEDYILHDIVINRLITEKGSAEHLVCMMKEFADDFKQVD
ncbi:TrmB family transcriptional regulator [Ethanoligenens sp.]|uniref:TrmB family transcriptional regulator n=1 Tax=Ethanoligenens sp. TaxID=2099655 RepID=UPI0039E77F9D